MLIFITVLLVLIPAIAILYPLLRGLGKDEFLEDESSPQAELARRWDAALAGLKNAELESAIGNLEEEDYYWLRQQYMTEAALVLKGMELEDEQEREFLAQVEREVQEVRLRALGEDMDGLPRICPRCSDELAQGVDTCPTCGRPFFQAASGSHRTEEAAGE